MMQGFLKSIKEGVKRGNNASGQIIEGAAKIMLPRMPKKKPTQQLKKPGSMYPDPNTWTREQFNENNRKIRKQGMPAIPPTPVEQARWLKEESKKPSKTTGSMLMKKK